jgi:thioredoxin reductase
LPEAARSRVVYEIEGILGLQKKTIAIVGSGDAAFDYALNLAKRHNEVVILNRKTRVKCLPLLFERTMDEDGICYEEDAELEQVDFSDERLLLHYRQGAESRTLLVDFLVVAVGRVPELGCIPERARADYASLDNGGKFHLAGDVMRGQYRQTAIAVGDGLHAAMKIYENLKENRCR